MDKKEYVLKVLRSLKNDRELAPSLVRLVENNDITNIQIDAMVNIFKKAINTVYDKVQQQKLQKSISYLEKLKNTEQLENEQEKKDLASLEAEIDAL